MGTKHGRHKLAYLSFGMIDHNVVRLDISMHDTFTMTEIQSFEQLVDVKSHIIIDEAGVEGAKVCIVDILKDQAGVLL